MAAKRTSTKRKTTAKRAKKASAGVAKRARKAVSGVKRAAKNPKRTVKKAAANVHTTASRARNLGENIVSAGEILKQTADVVDAMAQRATKRVEAGKAPGKRKTRKG